MFIGRDSELNALTLLWRKRVSSFVTCRGRRRIGKSSLIEEFASRSKCRFIEIVGAAKRKGMTNADQLRHFSEQLVRQSNLPAALAPRSWYEAFLCLDSVIDDGERTVVLLDEVSWMGRYDPDFAATLKTVWDTKLKKHDRLILVVCGSVSTWIGENILENSAFAGRLSLNLVLEELPIRDCIKFWGGRKNLSNRDVLDVLSVTGGVPKYLEEIDASVSADENIRRMCFVPGGSLVDEFDQIFSEVFEESATVKKQMLRALAERAMTATELAQKLGVDRNGHMTRHLKELETAGFVGRDGGLNPETGKAAKIVYFRIRDNYTRFYLHHLEPRREAIQSGSFAFFSLATLAGWQSILGLQFENLVVGHYREFLPKLQECDRLILSAAPYRKRGPSGQGVQVDLLLQMRGAVYVVEVKRKEHIGLEVEREVADKVKKLVVKGRKSIRKALVYDGEIDPTLAENGYFDALIPFAEIMR